MYECRGGHDVWERPARQRFRLADFVGLKPDLQLHLFSLVKINYSMTDLRFAILGSGSRGNASLVHAGDTTIMVDCGFSIKETCSRLEQIDSSPEQIDAVLVTHEHGDHSRGVVRFCRRYDIPIWASRGTARCFEKEKADVEIINVHQSFDIGDVSVQPVTVPHDVREPCQFVFSYQQHCLGVLTDVGEITPHITQAYAACDAILLEFNHDLDMLWNGQYAASLKRRVAGRLGHLNNDQSCNLLKSLLPGSLRFVMAAHLSESNNTPDIVDQQLSATMNDFDCQYDIAEQDKVSDWYSLGQY